MLEKPYQPTKEEIKLAEDSMDEHSKLKYDLREAAQRMSSEKIVTYISNIDPEIYDYKRDDSLQDNENYYNLFNLTNLM
jgi:hypothetical protein